MRHRVPQRGEVWYCQFSRMTGGEIPERHPALILTSYRFNHVHGLAIVCPISHYRKSGSQQSLVEIPSGLAVSGSLIPAQVKSIDWRFRIPDEMLHPMCTLPADIIDEVVERVVAFIEG